MIEREEIQIVFDFWKKTKVCLPSFDVCFCSLSYLWCHLSYFDLDRKIFGCCHWRMLCFFDWNWWKCSSFVWYELFFSLVKCFVETSLSCSLNRFFFVCQKRMWKNVWKRERPRICFQNCVALTTNIDIDLSLVFLTPSTFSFFSWRTFVWDNERHCDSVCFCVLIWIPCIFRTKKWLPTVLLLECRFKIFRNQ